MERNLYYSPTNNRLNIRLNRAVGTIDEFINCLECEHGCNIITVDINHNVSIYYQDIAGDADECILVPLQEAEPQYIREVTYNEYSNFDMCVYWWNTSSERIYA